MGLFKEIGNAIKGKDDSAYKNERKESWKTQQYIEDMQEKSRQDLAAGYLGGDLARNTGIQSSMDYLGGQMPGISALSQDANVAAQEQYLNAMPQYQNAILGMPVNNNAMTAYKSELPDPAAYKQQLPDFGSPSVPMPQAGNESQLAAAQQAMQFNPQQQPPGAWAALGEQMAAPAAPQAAPQGNSDPRQQAMNMALMLGGGMF